MTDATTGELRRARIGVTLLFFTNGAVFANLVPRYPEIRSRLDLDYGHFGLAVAAAPLGAMALGLTAGALIRHFRSSRVATVSMVLMALAAVGAAIAPGGFAFAAALFAVGALDAFADVAQNSHGLRVQRGMKRSVLNGFHATWSVGAVIGGLMGGAAAGLHVPLGWHLVAAAALVATINAFAYRMLLTGPEPDEPHPDGESRRRLIHVPGRAWAVMGALAVIAIAGGWVEDAGGSWSASYLKDSLDASGISASFGFVALMLFHFLGRVLGDRLVDRFGQRAVARAGGLVAAAGMGVALTWPSVPGTIAGFACAGLGVATVIPAAMHAADQLPGFRSGTGLTVLSWVLRVGFLLSPPVVGAIADASSLRIGLLVVPVAGVLIAVFSASLSNERLASARADGWFAGALALRLRKALRGTGGERVNDEEANHATGADAGETAGRTGSV